ncbi:hypothetical protein ZHAS_00002245 [Anopheles sinensis]|uniref:Uncharacterized protein n=1 Tax=Anopheles sinensis TaxID=74873 RepID=A0A084VC00_ANOSI|nr:hypothetical protein ZHAS_00002245 [Anopheles sinensis]
MVLVSKDYIPQHTGVKDEKCPPTIAEPVIFRRGDLKKTKDFNETEQATNAARINAHQNKPESSHFCIIASHPSHSSPETVWHRHESESIK